jgi:hypothetical protein
MFFVNEADEQRFDAHGFKIDRIYRRKQIVAKSRQFKEVGEYAACIVEPFAPGWNEIAYEFAKVSGNKFKCFGCGRPEYAPKKYGLEVLAPVR